ncbi:MAG: VCBS repeat-containing protein [Planctomycetota bacterium]|nr:VCBS repeat-containing protein [Planctomycetota bacterium]MDG1983086.1 VCBS repeat-containing protein [Planctomycetota bacterium]
MQLATRLSSPSWPLGLLVMLLSACGEAPRGAEPGRGSGEAALEGHAAPTPVTVPKDVARPDRALTSVEAVEDETEALADRLIELAEVLRKRGFSEARAWFSPELVAHALVGHPVSSRTALPLEVERVDHVVGGEEGVGRDGFIASLASLMGDWQRVDSVLWKVKRADFQRGRPNWGRLELKIHMTGMDAVGGVIAYHGKATVRATKVRGQFLLDQFVLREWGSERRGAPLFTEVAASAGLAHTWARFGTEANNSFHWNGAAAGDVDGDGDWDLFIPSDGQNFLYIAQPDGTWNDEADERGVGAPDGGTGAVFFDCDNDGDQDLLVGMTSWPLAGGRVGGEPIRLFLNDGEGHFAAAPGGPGLAEPFVAYTLTVLDVDGDGWLDVHVCGYGRVDVEHNNSWTEATNGAPNGLLRNLGVDDDGAFRGFENIAAAAGVEDVRWSYAAAAADVDLDGDADLYVANDYGSNRLWINRGDGTFVDGSEAQGVVDKGSGMGASFGDLTGDGVLDLYVSNMSSTAGSRILSRLGDDMEEETHALLKKLAAGNSIFTRDGDAFVRSPGGRGGIGASWAWSPALFDVDLDGDLDVFCTNGFVTGEVAFDT